ncbi:MAG: hypothetical protein K0U86_06680 [Planctomycetes bacterium]|nr:hypothetical protein [Planctomycetota bacterium]MCH9793036.1 hypothetical protein [Planctomycetota bacterium]
MAAARRTVTQDEGTSTTKVIAMLMVAIALVGWAFAAAAYAHVEEGWRMNQADRVSEEGEASDTDEIGQDDRFEDGISYRRESRSSFRDFIWNAIRQIPNVFSVVAFNFQHRLWLVILIAVLEGGALFLGYVMGKID